MRVLVVEDSAVYRHLIEGLLREWAFDATSVNDGAKAWQLLQQPDAPRLVLLDWMLPGMDGIELCRRIRGREPYVYTVLLTAKSEKEHLLEAMEAGADDYLIKPFDTPELKARLLVGKRILKLQEDLVSAREQMRHAATHDSLTGIWNRRSISEFLRRELARAGREHKPLGVILADVDHFKAVNDSLGHASGDLVLQQVATRLCSKLRVYDGVGRYGGEEFLLVMVGCNYEITLARAEEIRASVANTPITVSGTERTTTLSMGVAVADGSSDLESLLHQADTALYEAKAKGRNRVEQCLVAKA